VRLLSTEPTKHHKEYLLTIEPTVTQSDTTVHTAYRDTTKSAYCSVYGDKVSLLSTEPTVTPQRVPTVHTAYCDKASLL